MTILLILLGWSIFTVQPLQAQGNIIWNVEYFNNRFLTDLPSRTEQITTASLGFDWGANSPGPGINVDNFSVRWRALAYFSAGTYRFSVLADDAVRILVDGNAVIDTLSLARAGEVLTVDLGLAAGNHTIQVEFQEYGGVAYLYFGWANVSASVTPPSGGLWLAQYYANPNLSGLPSLIQTEYSPARDWGYGSPSPAIPTDHFSARWIGSYSSATGTYRITMGADDGVRVYVDGALVVDEFHSASAATYTADVSLSAGQHTLVIEYYEIGGLAFLNYGLAQIANAPAQGGMPLAAVAIDSLNVRDVPDAITSNILTRISRGETYTIVGRNADSTWWQIQVGSFLGWVSGQYVTTVNVQNIPVTYPPSPAVTNAFATVTEAYRLNVRDAPISGSELTRINRGETYPVVGRNLDSSWWQINVNGTVGWVNGRFIRASNIGSVPVTSQTASSSSGATCPGAPAARLTVGATGRVTRDVGSRLRDAPSLSASRIGHIPADGVFRVLSGPLCVGMFRWWQLDYNGLVGWSAEGYLSQYWIEPVS